ncbi:pantothenate synthetase [Frankia canadensis]|uniref:Pantothenate synthetase n=1 Tax=Frankia canadensis TaxID=1836972 RepID=A0A2I2KSJ4_9ACTN|nr:pantoate--beta-alanine ligase [Frankia canadensis]SNQ48609.1 pantothenate synthetase [Frankia canadensis]SOU55899.1 pantothenate synthetase [Frankia canadensis]
MSTVLPSAPERADAARSALRIAPSAPARPAVAFARDRDELRAALDALDRRAGPTGRGTRAVVMTMGALHEGHASLLRAARERADQVVATIYVNPLQFGAGEDLDRYPRTLDADLSICAREGVDVVFAPAIIHDPKPLVRLSAGPLGEVLEGASRPGHFDGMLTVVATLLHLTRPDLAFFGRKDAQQLVCIRRMVADLAFGVTVVGVETVREPDGLALSSRNVYLTPEQRGQALALSRALRAGAAAADTAPADADLTDADLTDATVADPPTASGPAAAVLAAARTVLDQADGVDVDYLELVSPDDLGPVTAGPALLLVAARVGSTRLIDNISLTLPADRQGA